MRRLIVEADGGSRGNPGPAAYGSVVRDADTGEVLAERAASIGVASNNVAEYRGLIAGLEAVREIDPAAAVEARLDSKLVVEQMSGRWKIKHPDMKPLALQARALLPADARFTWVPRERNKHADRLANEAMDAAVRGEEWSPRVAAPAVAVDEAEVPAPVAATPTNRMVGWASDLGAPTTTVLLRHGATEHTVARRFSGSGGDDPPLVPDGERQVAQVAALLAARGTVEAVVSSPLRRTRQTADAVAAELGLEVREVDGLKECDFGAWEGHTFAEVSRRWPDELTAWLGSASVAPPGGESFDAVSRRVRRARDQVLARYSERTVLLVTHVTPIKTLVRMAVEAPPAALYRMELSPASLSVVQWYAETASLRLFNDTGHLRT